MSKIQQKTAFKKSVASDKVVSQLLECHHDIRCINHTLKYFGSVELTLEEIGVILGVTRERVRQIESSALKKLRNPKIGRVLREYMTE